MSSENPVDQNQPAAQTKQDTVDKNSPIESAFLAVLSSEVRPPPTHPCYKISCDKERDGWDYAKIVAEFIGLGFLIAYTIYTAGIYCANRRAADAAQNTLGQIQQQTTLIQQQVEGQMAAIITKQLRINWPDKRAFLSIILDNRGRVIGSKIHGNFRIVEVSLPSEGVIDDTLPQWKFNVSEITPSPDMPIEKGIYLNVSREQLKGANNIPKAIKVMGEFTYLNGFKDKSETVCYYVIGAFRTTSQGLGETVITCDGLPAQIAWYKEQLQ
jgi:hypothetical protein